MQLVVPNGLNLSLYLILSYRDLKDYFITPCGGCRQIIAEFGYSTKCRVILVKSSGEYKRTNIIDLLPDL